MSDLSRDLNLMYELGAIRHIDRMWKRFLNADFANNTEHLFRVAWIALIIAKYEKVEDTGKIVKIAIAHDIAESRTGDVDYLSRQYVERKEQLALDDMLEGTIVEDEIKALLHEYEVRESIEAKIVKDADNLDVDLELREQAFRGHELGKREDWLAMRRKVRDTKMYTETAKKIAKAIQDSDPHAWHSTSKRNRSNGGDWKK
jgi:putative hydrolases of HD superfamily